MVFRDLSWFSRDYVIFHIFKESSIFSNICGCRPGRVRYLSFFLIADPRKFHVFLSFSLLASFSLLYLLQIWVENHGPRQHPFSTILKIWFSWWFVGRIEEIDEICGLLKISKKIPIFLGFSSKIAISDIREFFAKRKI